MSTSGVGTLRSAARQLLLPLFGALMLTAPATIFGAKPEESNLLERITVTGSSLNVETSGTGEFVGRLTVTGLLLDESGELGVQGFLTGIVSSTEDETTQVIAQIFSTSATLTGSGNHGRCESVTFDLAAINLPLVGLNIKLEEIELNIADDHGPGKLLGNLLCSLTRVLGVPNQQQKAEHIISRINDQLRGLVFGIPVTGELPGGTFTGFLTITGVAVNPSHELVIYAVVNGVANIGGAAIPVVNRELHVITTLTTAAAAGGPGTPVARCETLVFDPHVVVFTPVAREIDLGEFRIDVAPLRGEKKRLANLFCSLARALESESPSVSNIIRQINAIIFF